MVKISVVINTFQEEENISDAIKSAKKIADEIVVVDTYSTDKTVAIAKELGANVYLHNYTGYVEPVRNFAISKAKGEWIFILDADERIPDSLAKKIKKVVIDAKADYYTIPRKNIIFGKWIKNSRWWPDYNVRFFKRGHVNWVEQIHGVPETDGVGADLEAKEEIALEHYHYSTIEQYLTRLNRYTSIQAKNLAMDGYKFNWTDIIVKPTNEFVSRYFSGKGYKDGLHGLALGFLQAFSELVLYLKVWQTKGFTEENPGLSRVVSEMTKAQKELNYWKADSLVSESGSIVNRIKRKLKLQ